MSLREPPDHVGYLIGDVSRMLRTVYDRRVEPLGLTRAQWRVLAHLSRNEGIKQAGLADILEIKPINSKSWEEHYANFSAGFRGGNPGPACRSALKMKIRSVETVKNDACIPAALQPCIPTLWPGGMRVSD